MPIFQGWHLAVFDLMSWDLGEYQSLTSFSLSETIIYPKEIFGDKLGLDYFYKW